MKARQRWNSVVHLRPGREDHCLNPTAGGTFVSVFALAYSETNFRELVRASMDELGLVAIEFSDLHRYDPASDLSAAGEDRELNDALSDEWPVQYRTFHNYPLEDTNG